MTPFIKSSLSRGSSQTPNSRQRGIRRFEEFLHRQLYRLPVGATSLPSTQRRGTRHQDLQGTLCDRALLSRPRLPIALVGQTIATSGNHVESPTNLETASTALRRCALPWSCGLQQNRFCSARMQNNCTRKTRKAKNLGSPRAAWILIGSRNASLPMSKCIHLGHGQ
jgi:hypothetical protein